MTEVGDAPEWSHLRSLIDAGDANALTLAVDDLDEHQRTVVAAALRAHARAVRAAGGRWQQPHTLVSDPLLAVVGVGVLPDAKSVALWLSGHGIESWTTPVDGPSARRSTVPHLHFLLTRRDVTWLGELTDLLARRLSSDPRMHNYGDSARFDMVQRLVAHTGQAPPLDPGYVVGWLVCHMRAAEAIAAIHSDRRLGALVARSFEIDHAAALLDSGEHRHVVRTLVATGVVDRTTVLDAALNRLGTPARSGVTRAVGAVLADLRVTQVEAEARIPALLAVIDAGRSPVAAWALEMLQDLDRAGRCGVDDAASMTRSALARPEKKLVREQLAHLRSADPARARVLGRAVAESLVGLSPDLQRSAIGLLGQMASTLPESERAALAALARLLPRDMSEQLAAVLRVNTEVMRAPAAARQHAVARTGQFPDGQPEHIDARMLEPITELDALVAELERVFDWVHHPDDPARVELVVDALLRWGPTRSAELHHGLRKLMSGDVFQSCVNAFDDFHHAMSLLVVRATGSHPPPPRSSGHTGWGSVPGPADVLAGRIAKLVRSWQSNGPVAAISRPTWDNGMISLDDMVDRLARAARSGIEPWPVELEQALLRLAMPTSAEDVDKRVQMFRPVDSAAARYTVDWLRRVHDAPIAFDAVDIAQRRTGGGDGPDTLPGFTIRAGPGQPSPAGLLSELVDLDSTAQRWLPIPESVAWLAPSRRELLAVLLLRQLPQCLQGAGEAAVLLPLLAASPGAAGPVMSTAIAYGLSAARSPAVAHAIKATVELSRRRLLSPDSLAQPLSHLIRIRAVPVNRTAAALARVGEQAPGTAWGVLRAVLGGLLTSEHRPAGLAQLLSTAAQLVERTGLRGDVAGLGSFAAATGNSRRLVEARRLDSLLRS